MPSRVSWPVMGGPTANPTGVTLASCDPPSSLNAPEGSFGRHPSLKAAPRLVLLEGPERYCSLAGVVSAVGLSEPGIGTQSALLRRIRSSEEVACLTAGKVVKSMDLPLGSPGRSGERGREETVER